MNQRSHPTPSASTARVTSVTFRISGDRHLGGSSTPLRSPRRRENPMTLAKPGDDGCAPVPALRFRGLVIVPPRDFFPGPPGRALTPPSLHSCLFPTNRQLFPPGRPERHV